MIALIALALGALPAYAQSGSPFTDSRDAAARQYDTTTPSTTTTTTTTTTTPVGPSGSLVTPQSEGAPTTGTTPTTSTPTETAGGGEAPSGGSGEGNAPGAGGGNAPVKVTPAVKAKTKGTLPFTGRDLTIFVLIALALILAGTLLAIAERKTRNRRGTQVS